MDIAAPLRSLVPSLDSAVLQVLSGIESGLGPTQIARLAGRGSRQGIQIVLDRLTEHGLVLAEPTNRGSMYRLNRAHLLTPVILLAARARIELMTRMTAAVRTLEPAPVHASLFGSFSRGEGDEDSDIDLFLLMPTGFVADLAWETQMRQFEDDVVAWTGNHLETVTLDENALARAVNHHEPLITELRSDAVTLHGPDIHALTANEHESVSSA